MLAAIIYKNKCIYRRYLSTKVMLLFFFFEKTLFVSEDFEAYNKIDGKVQRFPIYCLPHACTASPTIDICHRKGNIFFFFTKDGPTGTHCNDPKVHSLPCRGGGGHSLVLDILCIRTNV